MENLSVSRTAPQLVRAVRKELEGMAFPLPQPASGDAAAACSALIHDLDDAVLPALERLGEAAVIGVVGATGVGKSTLVNGLLGKALSEVSSCRPTTRKPRLFAHPDTVALLGDHPARRAAAVMTDWDVPVPWALMDCGDPFAAANDPLTAQPDVPVAAWLVVASGLRYGDSLLWDLLRSVAGGRVPVALVVDRLTDGTWEPIEADIRRRLDKLGGLDVALLPLPELDSHLDALPADVVQPVRQWLEAVVPPAQLDDESVQLRSALARVASGASQLADAQAAHQAAVDLLLDATRAEIAAAAASAAGEPLGELDPRVAEAWLDQIGPDGPLSDLRAAAPASAVQRTKWAVALGAVANAVSDAVHTATAKAPADAWVQLVRLWKGERVPAGTRELLGSAGLAELKEDRGPRAVYALWTSALAARLESYVQPAGGAVGEAEGGAQDSAAGAVGIAGLTTLAQAAALGADGPTRVLRSLLGDKAEQALADARSTLDQARIEAVEQTLAAFTEAVLETARAASSVLPRLAERLAHASAKVPT